MITKEDLIALAACKDGLEWFLSKGLDKVENNEAIIKTTKHNTDWGLWLADKVKHSLLELKDREGHLLRQWEYDGKGNIQWKRKYDREGHILCQWERKYDGKGHLLWEWERKYDGKGHLLWEWEWQHDDKGYLRWKWE